MSASTAPAATIDTQLLRLAFLRKSGWEPAQVLDVGAHQGHWARSFRTMFPDAEVFMIEADARHEASLRRAGLPYHIGPVGRSEGMVEFHTLENLSMSQGASIYRENTEIYEQRGLTMQLPMRRVDDVVGEAGLDEISFIKLDVQGAEIDVLEGATHVLATHPVDFILAELSLVPYNDGAPLANDVCAYMRDIGFGMHDVFELHYGCDQLGQIDVLFARRQFLTAGFLARR